MILDTNFSTGPGELHLAYFDPDTSTLKDIHEDINLMLQPFETNLKRLYLVGLNLEDKTISVTVDIKGSKKYSYSVKVLLGRDNPEIKDFDTATESSTVSFNNAEKVFENGIAIDILLKSLSNTATINTLILSVTTDDLIQNNDPTPPSTFSCAGASLEAGFAIAIKDGYTAEDPLVVSILNNMVVEIDKVDVTGSVGIPLILGITSEDITATPIAGYTISEQLLYTNKLNNSTRIRLLLESEENSTGVVIFIPVNNNLTTNVTNGSKAIYFCLSPKIYTPPVQSFDFAVIRYSWTSLGGKDLDTRTAITDPPRNVAVGWSKAATDGGYLTWGGDNTNSGSEAILFDYKGLSSAFPDQNTFEIELRAFWFSSVLSGELTSNFTMYSGGTMYQNGLDFVNSGGVVVQNISLTHTVLLQNNLDIPGTVVSKLLFNKTTNVGELIRVT